MTTATSTASLPNAQASEQLKAVARSGFSNLVEIIPGAVGKGLLGAIKGLFRYGIFGLALGAGGALVARLRWELPVWLVTINAVVAMVALALAGAYASGLKAALIHLADQMEKRGVVRALYALIRPTLLKAAKAAGSAATPLTQHQLTKSLQSSVSERLGDAKEGAAPASFVDRVVKFIAGRLQKYMVFGVIAQLAVSKDSSKAAAELEHTGLENLEAALSDFVVDLFGMQTKLALAIAFVAATLPTVLYVLLS